MQWIEYQKIHGDPGPGQHCKLGWWVQKQRIYLEKFVNDKGKQNLNLKVVEFTSLTSPASNKVSLAAVSRIDILNECKFIWKCPPANSTATTEYSIIKGTSIQDYFFDMCSSWCSLSNEKGEYQSFCNVNNEQKGGVQVSDWIFNVTADLPPSSKGCQAFDDIIKEKVKKINWRQNIQILYTKYTPNCFHYINK